MTLHPDEARNEQVDLAACLEGWSRRALEQDWVSGWTEGAIFPCEMVYFLAKCEHTGVQTIVESGRQDGFSTMALGEYALAHSASVHSIDLEIDAERARLCHARLQRYPIDLVKGNAFVELPRLVRQSSTSTAILIDGPKGWPALSMLYGLASEHQVRILAQHNLGRSTPWYAQFMELAGGSVFYEQVVSAGGPAWQELRQREAEALVGGARSVEQSTLAVLDLEEADRSRLASKWDHRFGLNQPRIVRLGWSLGLYGPTRYLFSATARFLSP